MGYNETYQYRKKLFTQALGCLKIMISNQVTDVNEAYRTVKSLDVATDYLDLMCYDVYKVERALLNPMALALKPRLQQLLRGKNFVLFYALSLHLMLKHINDPSCTDAQRLHLEAIARFFRAAMEATVPMSDAEKAEPFTDEDVERAWLALTPLDRFEAFLKRLPPG